MKKYIISIILSFAFIAMKAQPQMQTYGSDQTLWETVTGLKTKTDRFNLYLNMHNSLDFNWDKGDFTGAKFNMKQLRIEAKGNINDWIYYRYRQRLNRSNDGSDALDNLPTSIDYAAVGFRVTPKFTIFGGKQCASYGGFEFDLNPIEIYEYSDMIEYMSNFMTGVNFIYAPVASQEFCFQVLDSRNYSFERTYGNVPEGVEESKFPFVYTLNWNGSFADGLFNTRYSASMMQQANNKQMWYFALGNELNVGKVNTFLDFMYALQGLDRKSIMTDILNKGIENDGRTDYTAMHASYMSLVYKLNYRVMPKWNLFAKLMFETAGITRANEMREKGKYRTSYGYIGGIEYYPSTTNLHFFLTYAGRAYDFDRRAKDLGWRGYSTNLVTLGFIYQLPMF